MLRCWPRSPRSTPAGRSFTRGALTTAAWLRARTRATPAEAATTVRTAAALRRGLLPGTAAALAAGEISTRHAQTIADGIHTTTSGGHRGPAPAEAVALIEPEALDVARQADTRAVASVMAAFAHALDPDAADAAALRRYERRGLTLSPTPGGTTVLCGLADEGSAAVLVAAIDAAAPLVTGETRTPAQTRLDALTGICRQWLENPDTPTRGGGGHPHIIVTTDDTTLFPDDHTRWTAAMETPTLGSAPDATATDGTGPASPTLTGSPGAVLSGIGRIPAGTARRLACDGELTTVLLGPDGAVTATRTERRFFSFPQRRAMIARDGDRCPWLVRPPRHLVRRPPPRLVHPRWPDHRRQRRPALPWAPHDVPRRRLDPAPRARRPLHRHTRDGRTLGPEPHPPGRHRPGRPPPQRE